jgi:tetratricopeptide (TPR) repeat protein
MGVGSYQEAYDAYDEAAEISSNSTDDTEKFHLAAALRGEGNALAKLRRYNESLQAFDRAIETYPSSMDKLLSSGILEGKGDALEAMGRHEEAIAVYDDAIDAHPKNAPVIYKKGQILKALGLSSEANAAFAKAKELGYEE